MAKVRPQRRANHPGAYEHAPFLSASIAEMVTAGAAQLWGKPEPPPVVLPLNVIPKPRQPGKFRLLLDGRPVNDGLYCLTFKYERLTDLEHLLQPNEFMVGIDLTAGYWQMRMAEEAQPYLGFEWEGRYYVFCVMPFGLKSAPWGFTMLMREFCAYLRGKGYRVINYLDDFLFLLGCDKVAAERARDALLGEFASAGLGVNRSKSQLEPVRRIRCLGLMVDSAAGVFEVPADRWANFQAAISEVLAGGAVASARQLARVVGHAVSLHTVVGRLGRFFTRACTAALEGQADWERRVAVTDAVVAELRFWQSLEPGSLRTPIWKGVGTTALTINTDASDFGWSGVRADTGQVARGTLPADVHGTSSAQRELTAVLLTLQSFDKALVGQRVHVLTDSTNARAVLEAGSGKPHLHDLALQVFWWCKARDVTLTVSWVPREQNVVADAFSKLREGCDWKLDPQWFRLLDARWGPHTIDRFASDINSQLPRFNSLYFCPTAEAVDCFAQQRRGENNWCNPPFALIGRLWAFLRWQGAVATVVVPVWRSAVWWPLLCSGGAWAPAVVGVQELYGGFGLFRPVTTGNAYGVGRPHWRVLALRVDFRPGWQLRRPLACMV